MSDVFDAGKAVKDSQRVVHYIMLYDSKYPLVRSALLFHVLWSDDVDVWFSELYLSSYRQAEKDI